MWSQLKVNLSRLILDPGQETLFSENQCLRRMKKCCDIFKEWEYSQLTCKINAKAEHELESDKEVRENKRGRNLIDSYKDHRIIYSRLPCVPQTG